MPGTHPSIRPAQRPAHTLTLTLHTPSNPSSTSGQPTPSTRLANQHSAHARYRPGTHPAHTEYTYNSVHVARPTSYYYYYCRCCQLSSPPRHIPTSHMSLLTRTTFLAHPQSPVLPKPLPRCYNFHRQRASFVWRSYQAAGDPSPSPPSQCRTKWWQPLQCPLFRTASSVPPPPSSLPPFHPPSLPPSPPLSTSPKTRKPSARGRQSSILSKKNALHPTHTFMYRRVRFPEQTTSKIFHTFFYIFFFRFWQKFWGLPRNDTLFRRRPIDAVNGSIYIYICIR